MLNTETEKRAECCNSGLKESETLNKALNSEESGKTQQKEKKTKNECTIPNVPQLCSFSLSLFLSLYLSFSVQKNNRPCLQCGVQGSFPVSQSLKVVVRLDKTLV